MRYNIVSTFKYTDSNGNDVVSEIVLRSFNDKQEATDYIDNLYLNDVCANVIRALHKEVSYHIEEEDDDTTEPVQHTSVHTDKAD